MFLKKKKEKQQQLKERRSVNGQQSDHLNTTYAPVNFFFSQEKIKSSKFYKVFTKQQEVNSRKLHKSLSFSEEPDWYRRFGPRIYQSLCSHISLKNYRSFISLQTLFTSESHFHCF